ncbi:MAG: DUF4097 family beta strand repeat-containing protein [Candidatus Hydrogenedentota bacterium]
MAQFFLLARVDAQPPTSAMGGIDLTGMVVFTREVENHYPITGSGQLFVSNQFGAIRVSTWDNPVINMKAVIRVGAENLMQAERFAQTISVEGSHVDDRVELRTVYPDVDDASSVGYTVELQITVPSTITLAAENRFGDIFVSNVNGQVNINSSYGAIGLQNLGGRVHVRAKGDFPLEVRGLPSGGTFFLRSTQSQFSDIGGTITINNYLGSIHLDQLHETAQVSATCDNGPIRLILAAGAKPSLLATTEFGDIESDFPVTRQRWGKKTLITIQSPDAQQHIELNASFGSILIQSQSLEPLKATKQLAGSEPVREELKATIPFAEGQSLLVDAMGGDVTLEATGVTNEILFEATRFVRVNNVANARKALEGLAWTFDDVGTETRIRTTLESDVQALGITEYKMHLRIRYPKAANLKVVHQSGMTSVHHAEGTVGIEQKSGDVHVVGTAGAVDIAVGAGHVDVRDNTGSVTVTVEEGTIRTQNSKGVLKLEGHRGRIVMESPGASAYVRNTDGDVRIVALEGVFADIDVMTTNGNINMVIPPTSDVLLMLNAENGTVYSSFTVTGSLEKRTQTFQGRLNGATHRVLLQTIQGNIVLD